VAAISSQYLCEIRLQSAAISSCDRYPFSLAAIRRLDVLALHLAVTFFMGENSSGKSTLLEAIAVASGFNPEGGTRNFRFNTRASHSEWHQYLRLARGLQTRSHGLLMTSAPPAVRQDSAERTVGSKKVG
jgi:predicted ATPase